MNLMKFNKLFMGFLGALALSSCSSEIAEPDKPIIEEGDARYMSVSIRNSNPNTRAGGDQTVVDGTGEIYEEGYTTENDVKSLRFYFFKEDGTPAPVKYTGENYYDCGEDDIVLNDPSSNMPNEEKILNALVVTNVNSANASVSDIKQMVAVVNYKAIETELGKGSLSLDQLSEMLVENPENCMNESTGFLMTNSSFVNGDGAVECAKPISQDDLKSTIQAARENPIDVYVERLVAKVRVRTVWNEEMTLPIVRATLTENNVTAEYEAVGLMSKIDGVTAPITVDGKQVYVIFKNWKLWWTADKTYLLKKLSAGWDSSANGLNWNWNDMVFHRSYWAENPAGLTLQNFAHNTADKVIAKSSTEPNSSNFRSYSEYCLENAADPDNNGLKKNYSPDSGLTNRTLVYLSAVLVTLDGEGDVKVATPLPLVEWSGHKYTEESAIAAMFEPIQNIVYFRNTVANDNGGEDYTYIPVQVSDLEFVSGLQAGIADNITENSRRYMSFINIRESALEETTKTFEGVTYNNVEKGKLFYKGENGEWAEYADSNAANDVLESVGGARVWREGNTYYYHEITHLGTTGKDGQNQSFRFGVVRNHIYDVEINSVFGLGTPVLSPKGETDEWEDIIPQKPTPDANLLGVELKILSWRVVNNNVSLEW